MVKKFQAGDLAYVNRPFDSHVIGRIVKFAGFITEKETNKKKEVYQILVGRDLKYFNEKLLDPLDMEIIADYRKMREN